MSRKTLRSIGGLLAVMVVGLSNAWAAPKKAEPVAPVVELSATGQKLEAQYAAELKTLRWRFHHVTGDLPCFLFNFIE